MPAAVVSVFRAAVMTEEGEADVPGVAAWVVWLPEPYAPPAERPEPVPHAVTARATTITAAPAHPGLRMRVLHSPGRWIREPDAAFVCDTQFPGLRREGFGSRKRLVRSWRGAETGTETRPVRH